MPLSPEICSVATSNTTIIICINSGGTQSSVEAYKFSASTVWPPGVHGSVYGVVAAINLDSGTCSRDCINSGGMDWRGFYVENLVPGVTYSIQVQAVIKDATSEVTNTNCTTRNADLFYLKSYIFKL